MQLATLLLVYSSKIIGLFCKRALQKRPIFSKETYNASLLLMSSSMSLKWDMLELCVACLSHYVSSLSNSVLHICKFKGHATQRHATHLMNCVSHVSLIMYPASRILYCKYVLPDVLPLFQFLRERTHIVHHTFSKVSQKENTWEVGGLQICIAAIFQLCVASLPILAFWEFPSITQRGVFGSVSNSKDRYCVVKWMESRQFENSCLSHNVVR